MSKSVLLKSSLAKKYWMSLTGLFLCLFLVGHLLGNLQLFMSGEEGKRAFNEYAYFMQHNPFIKILSYVTYLSIIFHAIDGYLLAVQNKKARPVGYAANKPSANSSSASRNMAVLGTVILVFIVTHMANFWAKMHFADMPLHSMVKTVEVPVGQDPMTGEVIKKPIEITYYLTTKGEYKEQVYKDPASGQTQEAFEVKDETFFIDKNSGLKIGEGYKDLHSLTYAFFGQDRSAVGYPANEYALIAVIAYVISMLVLAFHLSHGFASAFQSLGLRHPAYTRLIKGLGQAFSLVIPLAFAAIPVYIYLTK
ncbi:MAG: succinate dehydrogenase cytochrome b subunit [Bacteroidota bacterium]